MKLRNFYIDNTKTMTLMGGMNVLESRDLAMHVAENFKEASEKYNINYIFNIVGRRVWSDGFSWTSLGGADSYNIRWKSRLRDSYESLPELRSSRSAK